MFNDAEEDDGPEDKLANLMRLRMCMTRIAKGKVDIEEIYFDYKSSENTPGSLTF